MTSREWYHRWLYQQAKSEVDMQTNRKPHLKLTWRGWQARLESHNGAAISIGVTLQDALRELSEFTGISFGKPAVAPYFRTHIVITPD